MDINVYHAKCHLSEANMIRMALKEGVKLTGTMQKCVDCLHGKAKRREVPKISSYTRANKFAGRVFLDFSGPFRTRALGGNRYMATFVDDYSRKKFTYLMKTKSKESALRVLKLFHNEVLDPIGVKMQILRTDNDGAFVNDEVIDYLCDLHVVREYTSDYTPQQNGVVETAIRDIKNLAVTLMNAANLHTSQASLYGQAILTASVVLNDAPHVCPGYQGCL